MSLNQVIKSSVNQFNQFLKKHNKKNSSDSKETWVHKLDNAAVFDRCSQYLPLYIISLCFFVPSKCITLIISL